MTPKTPKTAQKGLRIENRGKSKKSTVSDSKVVAPVALRHWFADHGNVERLRAITEDPTFALACAIVRHLASPTGAHLRAADPTRLAYEYAYLAGVTEFQEALRSLTVLPVDQTPETGWDYITGRDELGV